MNEVEKRTGFFESWDGSKIYFEERGSGAPLVLLYGIACSIHHWRHQVRHFSQNHKTIVMDYRGHQRSEIPRDRSTLNIESLARDVESLLKHLGIERATFLGHSFGAQVLLSLFSRNRSLFERIVMINGFASNPLRRTFGNQYAMKAFGVFKKSYEVLPRPMTALWRSAVTHPITMKISALTGGFNLQLSSVRDLEVYSRGVSSIDLRVFTELFEEMVTHDETSTLSKIDVPTLIIGGSKDSITPLSIQQDLARLIPHSEFMAVPFGSHCTPLDMPEYVNLRIEKFLKS